MMVNERLTVAQEQLEDLRAKLERVDMLTELIAEAIGDAENTLADATQNVKLLVAKDGD